MTGLSEHGARGALLRREGLYQSHIEKWRKARDAGGWPGPGGCGSFRAKPGMSRIGEIG